MSAAMRAIWLVCALEHCRRVVGMDVLKTVLPLWQELGALVEVEAFARAHR